MNMDEKEKKYVTWPFWLQFLHILYYMKNLLRLIGRSDFSKDFNDWIYFGIAFLIFGIIGIVMALKKRNRMEKYRVGTLILSVINVMLVSKHIILWSFVNYVGSRF